MTCLVLEVCTYTMNSLSTLMANICVITLHQYPQCQNHINALPVASIYVYTFLQVSNDYIKMRGLFICHICNWWRVMIIDILQVWRRDEM